MKVKPQAILLLSIPILLVLAPLSTYLFRSLKAGEIEQNVGEKGIYQANQTSAMDLSDKFENNKPLTGGKGLGTLLSTKKAYYKALQADKKEIQESINETDNHFEGYIKIEPNEPYTTEIGRFSARYNDATKEGSGLSSLKAFTEKGIEYKLYSGESFIELEKQQDLNDPATIKEAQKKLWIQQRLLYTFLKPSRRDPARPLVIALENSGGKKAISIDIPVVKTTTTRRKGKKAPQAKYNVINVSFTVKIDNRDLAQLIDEILSYTPHQDDSTIPFGIRDDRGNFKQFAKNLGTGEKCNPILDMEIHMPRYEIKIIPNAEITRKKEPMQTDQPIGHLPTDERDKELKRTTGKLSRPVTVSFWIEIYDYNTK